MAPESQPERMPYRLVITRRSASEVLLLRQPRGWSLPRVEVSARSRSAEQLVAGVKQKFGLEAYCLSTGGFTASSDDSSSCRCAILETLHPDEESPFSMSWMSSAAATRETTLDRADQAAVLSSLEDLSRYTAQPETGPFARPGWIEELLAWVAERIEPLGLRPTGRFRQLNASPTFSLVRIETTGAAVWFKATGEPNAHELPVSLCLSRLFPRYVPPILGVHEPWNGWLSAEVPYPPLDRIRDFQPWRHAAEELAELQIASIGKTTDLLETAGIKDLRLPRLRERIGPFLARMSELMAAQQKPTPAPLVESELGRLAAELEEACTLLESFGLRNTLGHLDFNPGNVLVSEDRCVFLDWAEACVTNPLLTFEYLSEHTVRKGIHAPAARECLSTAYLRPWMSFHSPEELRRALALSPIVAVLAYSLANDSWRSPDLACDPKRSGYFRSLTRRMYREALRATERSELCLR